MAGAGEAIGPRAWESAYRLPCAPVGVGEVEQVIHLLRTFQRPFAGTRVVPRLVGVSLVQIPCAAGQVVDAGFERVEAEHVVDADPIQGGLYLVCLAGPVEYHVFQGGDADEFPVDGRQFLCVPQVDVPADFDRLAVMVEHAGDDGFLRLPPSADRYLLPVEVDGAVSGVLVEPLLEEEVAAGADGRRPLAGRVLPFRVAVQTVGKAAEAGRAEFAGAGGGLEAAWVRADHGEDLFADCRPDGGRLGGHPFHAA